MKLPRLDRKTVVLAVLFIALLAGDVWYGQDSYRASGEAQSLDEGLAKDKTTLRTLQLTVQLSDIKKELADLESKAPPGLKQPLPSSADTLKVISDLLNTQSSGGKIVSFKARDSKTETIDDMPVQILGYEIVLQGNSGELLAMLRRVDESNLVSLKIQTFSIDRQQDNWVMKLDVVLNLLVAPPPTTATPGAKGG
ncbi:MAG: hypothetical protein Q7O66_05600 [Dehalococcoidia bacterium]|nr:hypothetical protein [Dehalococcoidia bacterium]